MQDRGTRRPPLWAGYVIFGAIAIVAYFQIGRVPGAPSWMPRFVLYNGIHLSALVALVVGIRRHRPENRRGWWLLVVSEAVYCAADLVFYTLRDILHVETFPNVADVLYLSAGALLIAALLVFIKGRGGRDRPAAIDAVTVGVGVALLSWVFLMAPYARGSLPLLMRATSLAYPVLDVVLLTLAVRLIVGAGHRAPAFHLLTGGLLLLVANDVVYGWMQLNGTYHTGAIVDGGWLVFYLCRGAAALHPSMRTLSQATEHAPPSWSRWRLALVAGTALLAPTVLAVQAARGHRADNELAIALASAVLFVLVIARLADVMKEQAQALRRNEEQHAALRATLAALEHAQQERIRLLNAVVEATERERSRLAAELHDGPIQRLAAVAYAIERADRLFTKGETGQGVETLRQLRDQVGDEIVGLRRLMAELRPPALDQGGLEVALRDYLDDFGQRWGIACRFEARLSDGALAEDIETVIYRVTQEALTNVARHAHANDVHVCLMDGDDDTVELEVRDDGRGFDPADQQIFARDGHFGLLGMRERVEAGDGSWELRTAPGLGTTVRARLPRRLSTRIPRRLEPAAVAS